MLLKGLQKFFNSLAKVEGYILVLMFLAMILTIIVQIASRYFLNAPLLWTEEVSRFLFVWMIMVGAGYCLHTGTHIRMDMFVNMMPRRVQRVLEILIDLLAIGLSVAMIPAAVAYSAQQRFVYASASNIPYIVVYSSVVVACVLLIIHLVEDLLKIVTGRKGAGKGEAL